MKALIVDDSSMLRMAVRKILGGIGVEYAEAANGQEAWDYLDKGGAANFMLLDWNMPVMNGYELLLKVRGDARFAGLTIVMLTTENQIEAIRKAIMAGANEYVMKPFTDEMLVEKLRMVVPDLT